MFVLFAVPCLSAKVELDFFHSFMETSALLAKNGISHTIRLQAGIAFIDHARNVLCHDFLVKYPDATDLMFIDDDIGWEAASVMRLLGHKPDIVGGIYPLKQDEVGFPVELNATQDTHKLIERDGLVQANFLPTGFMRLKRHAIEMMAADQPTYPHHRADGVVEHIKNIFHTGYYDGERWGEDVDFANRWRAKGGHMWVDPEITLSHIGRKRWCVPFKDAVVAARLKLGEMEQQDEKAEA